jgi:DtxR family Mn-dependent transcriptional regulator
MKQDTITQSTQDYLKRIFELTKGGKSASTTDLAARLGFAPASVTGMLRKLSSAERPLVIYRKHRGASLTAEGEQAALEVIRHHRLLETWLVQTLGYTWDEVHEEACRLEHVISEDFEARIAAALGHPERDPHGDPIPSANLSLPKDSYLPLFSLRAGAKAIIRRVNDKDTALLRHLEELDLIPGTRISVIDFSSFDSNLTVQIHDRSPMVLGPVITSKIYVEVF